MSGQQRNKLMIGGVIALVVIIAAAILVFGPEDEKVGNRRPTPTPEATDQPTEEATEPPDLQTADAATAIVAQTQSASTAIAQTVDAGSSGDDPTEIPATPTGLEPPIAVPATPTPDQSEVPIIGGIGGQQVASVDFKVVSEAGEQLGNGTVRLYSPLQMRLNESAEIIVELDLSLEPGVTLTALPIPATFTPTPRPTPLPTGATPRPTRTPPPLQGEGYVPVHEFMGAELLGVDRHNFRMEAVPADGLLNIQTDTINRWRWSIRPLGEQALGVNRLEVQIYLPLKRSDGASFRQETNLLPFEIEVLGDGAVNPSEEDDGGGGWLMVIGSIGGLGVLGAGGYWWVQHRRKSLRIFISYRRADSQGSAGRLYDRLARTFGKGLVFRDVEEIEYGEDFVHAIDQAVGACEVLIAVIGNQWLTAQDHEGRRRIDNPHDFVRLEIATALRRGIRVIPALVEDARMPAEADLPADLQELHRRNAIAVRNDSFDDDVDRLVRSLLE